jgi:ribonuclease BN (tRNA processing enzyme)
VKLTVIGCSPAWPNPGGAQSGYLLEDGGSLLLDCGPGVLARLRLRGAWPRLDTIAITHFHLDHWGDLVPWCWGTRHGPGARVDQPTLLVPPGGRVRLRSLGEQLGNGTMFEDTFGISEFEPGLPLETAGFRLTALPVPHYAVEAYGFRVESGSKVLAYSGDTGPNGTLAELAREADLFVCEATLGDDGEEDPRGHLSLPEAATAFESSGARRLLVTHRPAELPVGEHELAYDGLVIHVE